MTFFLIVAILYFFGRWLNNLSARQEQIARKQAEQAKKQERLRQEQERQAQQLKKHDDQIAKLEFRMHQAEAEIVASKERIGKLCALLDLAEAAQAAAVPGSPADERAQKKILSLESQIATAERKLAKARFDRSQAKKVLAA